MSRAGKTKNNRKTTNSIRTGNQTKIHPSWMDRRWYILIFVLIFAGAGSYVLFHGHAATPTTPPVLGGCQIFPNDNVWNVPVASLPVHANSSNFIATDASEPLIPYFSTPETGPSDLHYDGIPYTVVPETQPLVAVHIGQYAYESDAGSYPIPDGMHTEEYYDQNSIDHHAEIVQSGTCKLYELYGAHENADKSWNLLGGAVWDLNSNNLRDSAPVDAAGFPIVAGLVKYDEVASGAINHALRFLLNQTQAAQLWPAVAHDGTQTNPNVPPEGLRLRLKASVDITSFPPESRVILQALKTYGMILADQGGESGDVMLSGAPDNRWDLSDLSNLSKIHFSDFEAVDESKMMVSPNSGQVAAVYVPPSTATPSPAPVAVPSPTPPPPSGASSSTPSAPNPSPKIQAQSTATNAAPEKAVSPTTQSSSEATTSVPTQSSTTKPVVASKKKSISVVLMGLAYAAICIFIAIYFFLRWRSRRVR